LVGYITGGACKIVDWALFCTAIYYTHIPGLAIIVKFGWVSCNRIKQNRHINLEIRIHPCIVVRVVTGRFQKDIVPGGFKIAGRNKKRPFLCHKGPAGRVDKIFGNKRKPLN
jgi:hypothetical protein